MRHTQRKYAWLAAAGIAALAGCKMGPDYKPLAVDSPTEYRFGTKPAATQPTTAPTTQPSASLANLPWWDVFKDPALQDLIRTSLANNYDLKRAIARVEQARQNVIAVRAPLYPSVGYNGAIGRGKNAVFNAPGSTAGLTESSASVTVGATWELDVWGRVQRLSESAQAQYLATDAGRRAVVVSLVSETATLYFQLLGLDEQLKVQRDATAAFAATTRLFRDRFDHGDASKLEVDRAQASYDTAARQIPEIERRIAVIENQINLVLGRGPGPVPRGTLARQAAIAPQIPEGLPSELLHRRPDIIAAEQILISTNAQIGAAKADFFPQFSLTGFLGKVSPTLSDFSDGNTNAWNIGAALTGPIFQGGQLEAQYAAAKARFEEAKADYIQTVLGAFGDVSSALITREKLAQSIVFDEDAVASLLSSVDLANARYINGKASYYEVLQAQQDLYASQQLLVQTQTDQFTAVVDLYRVLGGGWQIAPEPPGSGQPQDHASGTISSSATTRPVAGAR